MTSLALTICSSLWQKPEAPCVKRTSYPRESSVIDVFRQQVTAYPSTIAVKDATTQLTYAELDQQSDQLSWWLAKRGLEAETLVGVFATRSCQTVVAFLGILKANLAYLPLDASAPSTRIRTILSCVRGHKLILVQNDMPISTTEAEHLKVVRIAEALQEQALAPNSYKDILEPSATSLAYVLFTSGSTGQPKGVMVEHRGIVRLARQSDICPHVQVGTAIAHIANIAFDASTWEIYNAILNGGTLVCFDKMTLLDPARLSKRFFQEDIRIAKLTSALLEQCLAESPSMFRYLRVLISAGDRLHPHIAQKALIKCPNGRLFNAYGPTENTGFSTCFHIARCSSFTDTVPIGQAISNSGAVVMDPKQRTVPAGVIGELVVIGDGLARGYLDPLQEKDRFINILTQEGRSVRAYRTGDFIRRRPLDGELEFFGRVDYQVKIRGHRVELGEVEHALLGNSLVSDAVALVQSEGKADSRLVGFVTLRSDNESQAFSSEQKTYDEVREVKAWAEIRKELIYAEVGSITLNQLGRDFMGWKSMYNGKEIDKQEMDDWLHDTLNTILNGDEAGHVLEIGTGTGMVLFNLGEGLQSYSGLEPVETLVDFTSNMARSIPQLADKVRIQVGTATDVGSLKEPISATTTLMNSVAQYFPSQIYFQKIVADLLRLSRARYLFFGDIRSYALYDEFLVTMAMHRLGARPSKNQFRQCMEQMKESEKELLIDPAFFTALKSQHPDLVEHVEILPKRMKASNELSCYRYAAVVHTKRQPDKSPQIYSLDKEEWIDFADREMDDQLLLNFLRQHSGSSIVAFSNIPHSRTFSERTILDSLNKSAETDGQWAASLNRNASHSRSLSSDNLAVIGEKAGFRVELSWARQYSQRGGLDAVFHHISTGTKGSRVLFRFPTDHEGRHPRSFTNQPLQSRIYRKIEKEIYNSLRTRLPSYMMPAVIKILDKMPTNENRKVDRGALAKMTEMSTMRQVAKDRVPPRNDTEHALCEEFATVLGVDVGITDSFFDLGGHSLMATRVISRINNRLGCSISVLKFYQFSTPAALCRLIVPGRSSGVTPDYLHHHSRPGSRAVIVLTHGFWGQGNVFLPLASLLDDHFDVILIHDPFFGKPEAPATIKEWAKIYLNDLRKCIPLHLPVILGGYSFGGLIAFEMASLCRDVFGSDMASILLLDAGSYPSLSNFLASECMPRETINRGQTIFGRYLYF